MADVGASVGKVRPVLTVVAEDGARREDVSLLDDVVREGVSPACTGPVPRRRDRGNRKARCPQPAP